MNTTPANPATAPSRARNVVLWFAATLAVITYVDRVCISQAAPFMREELHLSKEQMGYIFAAFGWAYALFEIPGGWLGDRIGPRKVLMRVVTMWSIFTIVTGWARSFWTLIVCRFLFGVGEAGCFPNITKAFTLWFPVVERVRAQGVLWLSARWGGAFTPLLVGWMLASGHEGKGGLGLHYKWVFLMFGLLGMVWAVLFYRWFRDQPKEHPSVNAGELAHIGDTHSPGGHSMPWGKLLASRTVWMLWMQYFFISYAWYFYITWFPTYLKEQFTGLGDIERALLACVPLFFGGIGSLFAGLVSARLDRVFGIARTRRIVGVVGTGGAAVMLVISIYLKQPLFSVLAVGMASFCNDITLPGSWGACMDVGGPSTGALAGSMNMVGNAGGALAPMIVPFVLKWTTSEVNPGGDWHFNIWMFAAAYLLAAVCWSLINSDERLHEEDSIPPVESL